MRGLTPFDYFILKSFGEAKADGLVEFLASQGYVMRLSGKKVVKLSPPPPAAVTCRRTGVRNNPSAR